MGLKYNSVSIAPEFAQPNPSRTYDVALEAMSPIRRDRNNEKTIAKKYSSLPFFLKLYK